MNSSRVPIVLLIILFCIGCDQATKFIARGFLVPGEPLSYLGDTFRLQYAENTGAFLSLGASLPEAWRHIVFTIVVGLILFALLLHLLLSRGLSFNHVALLSLVCGGGFSNLIDRIVYNGSVTDFLNIGIGSLRTGIFNVADLAITAGAILLAIDSLRGSAQDSSDS